MPPKLYPKFGVYNRIEKPLIADRIELEDINVPAIFRNITQDFYNPSAINNTGPYQGVVLRVDGNPNNPEPGSWVSAIFGFGEQREQQKPKLVHVKVRIPELHSMLPIPETIGDNSNDHAVINLYPTFIAQSDDIPIPEIGSLVWVDYGNKENFSRPIYIKPVVQSRTNMVHNGTDSLKENSPSDAHLQPCNETLLSEPPTGDPLPGENKTKDLSNNIFPRVPNSFLSKEYKFIKEKRFSAITLTKWEKAIKNRGTPGITWLGVLKYNGEVDQFHSRGKRETILFIPNKTNFTAPIELIYWFHGLNEFGNNHDFEKRIAPSIKKLVDEKRNFVFVMPELPWSLDTKASRRRGWEDLAWKVNDNFASFHREVLTTLKEKISNVLNVGFVSITGVGQGCGAIKTAIRYFNVVKPNKITFADGSYKDYLQETFESYISQNEDVEFNILVQSNGVPFLNAKKFLNENSVSNNVIVEIIRGKNQSQIGDMALSYINKNLVENIEEKKKDAINSPIIIKEEDIDKEEGAPAQDFLNDLKKEYNRYPMQPEPKLPLLNSANVKPGNTITKKSGTRKPPKGATIKKAVPFKEARVSVKDYGTLGGSEPILRSVPTTRKSRIFCHNLVARRLEKMNHDWLRENPGSPQILISSGWRRRKFDSLASYEKFLREKYGSVKEGRKWIAYASPHETGLAIDIGNNGLEPRSATNELQKQTKLYKWLVSNAHKYGFSPYKNEAWHWEVRIPRESWASGEEFSDEFAVRIEDVGQSNQFPVGGSIGTNCVTNLGNVLASTRNDISKELDSFNGEKLSQDKRIKVISNLARQIGIETAVAQAFLQVETGGRSGFCDLTGKALIRFEPHVFADPRRLKRKGIDENKIPWAGRNSKERKKKWRELGFQHGPNCRDNHYDYKALLAAIKIDEEQAYASTSVGVAQIMGFNHRVVGFKTAKEMFKAFSVSEEEQLKGFFSFIKRKQKGKLLAALKRKDFVTAALIYNGKGKENLYAEKLKNAYERFSRNKNVV